MTTTAEWGELAPPLALPPGGPDIPGDVPPPEDGPLCPVCGEVIVRQPSWRRMHKYHDECASKAKPTGRSSDGPRPGGSGYPRKVEQEADECERLLKSAFIKLALGVSVIDRFDAFCIMVNTPAVSSSFRGVCLRYTGLRKEILAAKTGGSVFGLGIALAFMLGPILAHHGLIRSKHIAEMMVKIPILLWQLNQRMQEGEQGLRSMMDEYMAEMKRETARRAAREEQAKRDANGEYVGPSPS